MGMTHIAVRRIALTVASVSFSLLTALVLIVSAAYGDTVTVAAVSKAPSHVTDGETVEFPFSISCTSLVVEAVAGYDGPFYEDGTGREVLNTAAVLLRNTGAEVIPYAHVILRTNSASYIFDGFLIPAGAAVLIPEKYASPYVSAEMITSCFGWATVMKYPDAYALTIEEEGMGQLLITNHGDADVRNLTLYHKTYLQENDLYIGGIAFETRVEHIGAGETALICPQNYAAGYSKVVYYE